MPNYIVLGSNHHWFACWTWSEVVDLAKEMLKNGCEYVKVVQNNKVVHWDVGDINIIK